MSSRSRVDLLQDDVPSSKGRLGIQQSGAVEALRNAGTDLYVDTADAGELLALTSAIGDATTKSLAGITMNQAFLNALLTGSEGLASATKSSESSGSAASDELGGRAAIARYLNLSNRIIRDLLLSAGKRTDWVIHVPLHLSASCDVNAALEQGMSLQRRFPSVVIKMPFMPHRPEFLGVARELEDHGVPINITCCFSKRQVLMAAALTNASFVSLFMGRIDRGLNVTGLGKRVALTSQEALKGARKSHNLKTKLLVAAIREGGDVSSVSGCDAITTFPNVIEGLASHDKVPAAEIAQQADAAFRGGVHGELTKASGDRLNSALMILADEPINYEYLVDGVRPAVQRDLRVRSSRLLESLRESDRRGLFYTPDKREWTEIRRSRLPDLDSLLAEKLRLDTLFTLLAFADFQKHQIEIDQKLLAQNSISNERSSSN